MKKLILLPLLFSSFSSFAIPQQPVNGGTGIANNNANTITTHAPMVFPDNLNFQYIYDHDASFPEVGLTLANNSFAAFEVLDASLNCMMCATPLGIYSDFSGGFDYRSTSDNTWFRLNHTNDDTSMALQLYSIEKGVAIFPAMTSTQKNAINMTSAQQGTAVYDTDQHALNLWDGSNKHPVLTDNHVLAGANSSITVNGDGTVTVSSSGGGTGPTAAWGSFAVANNSATMSVQTSYSPISVLSGFTDYSSSEFTDQLMTISGVQTPIAIYTGTSTQSFTVNVSESAQISSVITNTYYLDIAIRKANGTIINTPFEDPIILKNLNDQNIISDTGSVQLSQGDGVFFQNRAASAANMNPKYLVVDVTNKTGSIANTDGLPQGSNNLYLSQNGGTTFSNLSGAATLANIPRFSSTGGQLSDSGVPSSNILVSTASYVNPTWLVSLDGSKLTGTVTPNSAAGGDLGGNYPNPVVASNAINYAKFQQITALRLFGNPTGALANGQEISLGSTLNFSGTALQTVAITGDVSSSANSFATTLATVNSNVGSFGDATHTNTLTVTGKGLLTAVSSNLITPAGIGAPTITGTGASGSWAITATNASNVATTSVTTNSNFYPLFVASSTNSNQSASIDPDYSFNPGTDILSIVGLNISGLTASNLVATDSSDNLITASGTYGIGISGNAATVTTNANLTGPVTSVGNATAITAASITNAMLAGSIDLTSKVTGVLPFGNGGFGYSSATLGDIFLATATNTPGKLADVPVNQVLVSGGVGAAPLYSASPTLSTLTLNNGSSALSGITPGFSFLSALGAGNYVNWGSGGRDQGIVCGGNFFLSNNLDYNGTTCQYVYWSTAAGAAVEIAQGVISLRYTPSGSVGTNATMSTALQTNTVGDVLIPNGNLVLQNTGKTLNFKTGTNACVGSGATLVAGTVTVNTTCAKTGDIIILMKTASGGTELAGGPAITIVNNTSFTLTESGLATPTYSWEIHHTT